MPNDENRGTVTPVDGGQSSVRSVPGPAPSYDPTLRPVKTESGKWDALDNRGYGHVLGYASRELAEAWLDGYDVGARENQ